MFLPIGDEPKLRGTPALTYGLIAVNVAVFLLVSLPLMSTRVDPSNPALVDYLRTMAQGTGVSLRALLAHTSAYDLFLFEHGFRPGSASLVDLMTAMFLHAGWLHLIGNMLFLWIYGKSVEIYIGRAAYLIIYLATGAMATGLHAAFSLGSNVPMIGASGAISGVLGCYFLWFPRHRIKVFMMLGFFIDVIMLPARWVLGAYLILDNILPFVLSAGEGGVAHGAHIGGFIGGGGGAWAIEHWQLRGMILARATAFSRGIGREFGQRLKVAPAAPGVGLHDYVADFAAAVGQQRWQKALKMYSAMPMVQRRGLAEQDLLDLADWLTERGQVGAALAVLHRFVATHPTSDALPRAHLRAGVIHLHEGRIPAAQQNFLAVLDLQPTPEEEQGARAGMAEVVRRERQARIFRQRR